MWMFVWRVRWLIIRTGEPGFIVKMISCMHLTGPGSWADKCKNLSHMDTSTKIGRIIPQGPLISKITRANKIFRRFPKWRPFWKMAAIFIQTRVLPQKYV